MTFQEKEKLWKHAFDELLNSHGYGGKELKRLEFISKEYDEIVFGFMDDAHLSVNYSPKSLMLIDLSIDNETKMRLIPEGKPIHDEHYEDVLSVAMHTDFTVPEKEYEIWEPFSKKTLEEIIGQCSKNPLESIHPTFGLQSCLYATFALNQAHSKLKIGFKFPKNSIRFALYRSNEKEILYDPLIDSQ